MYEQILCLEDELLFWYSCRFRLVKEDAIYLVFCIGIILSQTKLSIKFIKKEMLVGVILVPSHGVSMV